MIEIIDIFGGDPMCVVQKPNGEWVTFCHPAFAEGNTPVECMLIEALTDCCENLECIGKGGG